MDLDESKYLNRHEDINERVRILPHWHQDGKIQFVTFHLSDSLPREVREDISTRRDVWLTNHPKPWNESERKEYSKLFNSKIDELLDNGYGECILLIPEISELIEDAFLFFNAKRYILHAYVIMSNHIHVLYETLGEYRPERIVGSWRDFTTKSINSTLKRRGSVWSTDFYDRIIRNDLHYSNVVNYIKKNISAGGVRWMI